MGKLIDVDEVKKRYPIMRNDFGMVINESLHKELDKIPTVEAISKADMVAILDKIRAEIEQRKNNSGEEPNRALAFNVCIHIIDKYRAEGEDKE